MAAKRIRQTSDVEVADETDQLVVPFRVVRPSVGTVAVWDNGKLTATVTYWTAAEYERLPDHDRPKNAQRFLDGMAAFELAQPLDLRPGR